MVQVGPGKGKLKFKIDPRESNEEDCDEDEDIFEEARWSNSVLPSPSISFDL